MTTIVCDRNQMSADSRAAGDECFCNVRKIFRIADSIYGFAGDYPSIEAIENYLMNGAGAREPDMEEIFGLSINKGGIYFYDQNMCPTKIKDDFAAIGSGEMSALTSMHLGASTHEAVQTAKKVDKNTGGPIDTLYLFK